MSNLLHESHCQGKKQNTIIGAFKRLSKLSSEKESKSEIRGSGTSNVNNDNTKVLNSIKIGEVDVSVTEVKPVISDKITGWKSALDGLEEGFTNKTATRQKIQPPVCMDETEPVNVDMPEKSRMVLDNENGFSKIKEFIGNEPEVNLAKMSDLELDSLDKVCDDGGKEDFKEVEGIGDVVEHTDTCDERSKTNMPNCTDNEAKVDISTGNSVSENKVNFSDENIVGVKEVSVASGNIVVKKEINTHIGSGNPNSLDKDNSSVFSPSLRKTRSGLIRTPVSQSRRKNKRVRNKQKEEGSAVTYTCPVCALNILCESLQTFNEHVDMCLESGEHDNLGSTSMARSNIDAHSGMRNETHDSCNSTLGENVTDEMCIVKAHVETVVNCESTLPRETSLNYDENLEGDKTKIAEFKERDSEELKIENMKISSQVDRSSLEDTTSESKVDTFTNYEDGSQAVLCSDNPDIAKQNVNKTNIENMRCDSNNSEVSVSEIDFKRITNTDVKCATAESNKPASKDTGGCDKDVNVETKTEPKLEETEILIRHTDALEDKEFGVEISCDSENSAEVRENKVEYKNEIDDSSCVESEVMEYGNKSKDNKVGHKTEPELPQLPEIRDLSDTEDSSESKDEHLPQIPLSPNIIIKNCTESPKNGISRYDLDQVNEKRVLGIQEMSEMDYPVLTTVGKELLKTSPVRKNDMVFSDEIEELNEEDSGDDIKGKNLSTTMLLSFNGI